MPDALLQGHSDYIRIQIFKEEIVMPKLKTKRAAAKRFKKTGSGSLKRNKAYKSHILTKKTTKRKRGLRKATMMDKTNEKVMKKILPYL
jgi:large subunit ribosomal protein L35